MSSNPISPAGLAGFSFRFLSLIKFWNHVENSAKQIAQLLLGESAMSMAITAEAGNRTLMEAIEVASRSMGEIGEHLRHFSKGYTTLLGYRNLYVHSIYGLQRSQDDPEKAEGVLFSVDGKGRVRYFSRALSEAELDSTINAVNDLMRYATAIQLELGATGGGIEALAKSYTASLEMPNWPPVVEKTPLYLQGQEPPPPEPNRRRGNRKAEPKS